MLGVADCLHHASSAPADDLFAGRGQLERQAAWLSGLQASRAAMVCIYRVYRYERVIVVRSGQELVTVVNCE